MNLDYLKSKINEINIPRTSLLKNYTFPLLFSFSNSVLNAVFCACNFYRAVILPTPLERRQRLAGRLKRALQVLITVL